ncbi:MAG: ankyrin repeat domain-containing protein [Gemmataceae bacterium]|nr:ankyrin repeat domain-containing protein [Gemmataceae bacterium]
MPPVSSSTRRRLPLRWILCALFATFGWVFLINSVQTFPEQDIHAAIWKNDYNRVVQLLKDRPELLESRSRMDRTPLLRAVEEHRIEILRLLIRRGADVNATTVGLTTGDGDWNGLHLAAHHDNQEAARILIQAGTSFHAKNRKGLTPRDLATKRMHWNIVSLISKAEDTPPK